MKKRSWIGGIAYKLSVCGVGATVSDLKDRTCGEVLAAEDWADGWLAHREKGTPNPHPRPAWLDELQRPATVTHIEQARVRGHAPKDPA